MTRVLVLGGGGLLGHKAFQVLGGHFDTFVTFRRFDERLRETGLFADDRVLDGVDADRMDTVRAALDRVRPDVVLNCIGLIKQQRAASDPTLAIYTNALFPHLLAQQCAAAGSRLIHVSTDCVFSGQRGSYRESDTPDADDLYGRTKLLGELDGLPHALTLRTSIIGRELWSNLSLVDWFLSQAGGTVRGFTRAIYTGLTTNVLAEEIARVIAELPELHGLYQVSSEPISKYDLLLLLRDAYGMDVRIDPYDDFFCDRSLRSERYRSQTGFTPPSWQEMVDDLAADRTPYDQFRRLVAC